MIYLFLVEAQRLLVQGRAFFAGDKALNTESLTRGDKSLSPLADLALLSQSGLLGGHNFTVLGLNQGGLLQATNGLNNFALSHGKRRRVVLPTPRPHANPATPYK